MIESSKVDHPASFKRGCGFCGRKFRSWEHRKSSMIAHFEGKRSGGRISKLAPLTMQDYHSEWEDNFLDEYCSDSTIHRKDQSDDDRPDDNSGDLNGQGRHRWFGLGRRPSSSPQHPGNTRGGSLATDNAGYQITKYRDNSVNDKPGCKRCSVRQRSNSPPQSAKYSYIKTIGRGSHSEVEKVQDLNSNEIYALKRVHGSGTRDCRKANFEQEVNILKKLHHPHIVHLETAYVEDSSLNVVMSPVAEYNL